MPWTDRDYARLGDFIVSAREQMGLSRQDLASMADVTYRTLGDIETGQLRDRKSFSAESLAAISRALAWPPGTWRRVLDDPATPAPGQEVLLPGLEVSVGGDTEDADTLLYRRPAGISDEQWTQLKAQTKDWIEWQLNRAAEER